MSLSPADKAYLRRKYLEEIYDRMTDEEKKAFIQITMQNKNHAEIMEALQQQRSDLEAIKKKQNWKVDFLSDVGANILTSGGYLILSKLFKR